MAQALLRVPKADASHAEGTPMHRGAKRTGRGASATEARTGHGGDAVREMLPGFVGRQTSGDEEGGDAHLGARLGERGVSGQ